MLVLMRDATDYKRVSITASTDAGLAGLPGNGTGAPPSRPNRVVLMTGIGFFLWAAALTIGHAQDLQLGVTYSCGGDVGVL